MSLPYLAESPTRTAPDPAEQAPWPGRAAMRKAHRAQRAKRGELLPGRYLGYVGYFVGAGLISGAVVHHPLDPARYTRIAAYGVLVFLAATVLNEFFLKRDRPALPRMLLVLGASLMLSFGIGMLSGGLQHFDDFPDRAAVLVPLGLVVSFLAYAVKESSRPGRRIVSLFGLAVAVIALVTYAGLSELAADLSEQSGAGGGHSHGGQEPAPEKDGTGGAEAPTGTASPDTAPGSSAGAGEEPGHADGHSH